MSEKLTEKEHQARAMLMGGWYGDKTHTYFFKNEDGVTNKRLCADTFAPLTSRQCYERIRERREARKFD